MAVRRLSPASRFAAIWPVRVATSLLQAGRLLRNHFPPQQRRRASGQHEGNLTLVLQCVRP